MYIIVIEMNLTLYGVSIINLPSLDTQGIVPCWKNVTCNPVSFSHCGSQSSMTELGSQNFLTWSASRPKYLWLSKNLRVGSSVNGLVIMYQCIGGVFTDPVDFRVIKNAGQGKEGVRDIGVLTLTDRLRCQSLKTENSLSLKLEKWFPRGKSNVWKDNKLNENYSKFSRTGFVVLTQDTVLYYIKN